MIENRHSIQIHGNYQSIVKYSSNHLLSKFLRFFPLLISLCIVTPLHSEVLGSFTAGTNYLWRGVTQTVDTPAIAAAIEYHAYQGSYLGIWSSSINYGDRPSYELHAYLGHEFNLAEVAIDITLRHYYFPTGGKYSFDFQPEKWDNKESSSFNEFQTGVTYKGLNTRFAYSDSYLASDRPGYYLELNYTYYMMDELSFKLHAGSTKSRSIDDTQNTASDQAVTITWTNFFAMASNMPDNEDGRQSDKIRYLFGWNMVISTDSKNNSPIAQDED